MKVESPEPLEVDIHALPELGETEVPADLNETSYILEDAITSDQLADMMDAFRGNVNSGMADSATVEIDSDEEDAVASSQFARATATFRDLERSNRATAEDVIDFKRMQNAEMGRVRAREQRKEHERDAAATIDGEDTLFIPENSPEPEALMEATTPTLPSRETTPKPKSKGRLSKSSKKTKSLIRKTQVASKVSKTRKGRKPALARFDTDNLLHHDIIAAATANQGRAAQPGFATRNKQQALSDLIASLPVEERNIYASEKADLTKATRNFNGRAVLKADGNGNWKLRGMRTSMHHYQLLGVSWMRDRENKARHPRGGILGDDMGMGKTVSALTNMVDGRPTSSQKGARATLVIVPSSLMTQWMSEIEKHVETTVFRQVMTYRSSMRVINPATYLGDQDIVITSYHEVARSLPSNNPPPSIYTTEAKAQWWAEEVERKKGPLHQVYWHRIVLDEAQAIKNHLSKTSEAVCQLKGRYRWCLSGTPIQNSLDEFYPYFRFLRYENTGSFELFKRNFTKRGSTKALQRLQAVLGNFMLRRTHLDKIFGRPILQLPPIKPIETIEVDFNVVERTLYNIVLQRFVARIKALSKKSKHEKNHQQYFVLLLRLRQLVGHPLLTQKTLKDLLEMEDLYRLDRLTKVIVTSDSNTAATDNGAGTARGLQVALGKAIAAKHSGPSKAVQVDNMLSQQFRGYLQALRDGGQWAEANARALCCACNSPPTHPHITTCSHLYCRACLNELQNIVSASDAGKCICSECGTIVSQSETFVATTPDAAESHGISNQTPEEDIDWYKLDGPILRSAKIKGAVAKIKEWFTQDATNKIIVFTQFRGLIKIMERICREERWGCASYHGEMTFDYRDDQVHRFSNDPDCRILLAALKAGGVGLNLTAANRVIILDLWWNSSVESQAYTRCFRIGQKRDVEVARFVVRNSIDTEIQRMQERKASDVELAMDHDKRTTLSTTELLQLFHYEENVSGVDGEVDDQGPVHDGEDEPFVFPDDPHDPSRKPDGDTEVYETD